MTAPTFVAGGSRIVLRFEGAALFCAASVAYWWQGGGWLLYAVLFFTPDFSFVAYLAGPRLGALAYNALHATLGPLALAAAGLYFAVPTALLVAMIWLAHVGFDRALGYGLKYASAFADTHLGRIGQG